MFLPALSGRSILVIGDVMLDEYISGEVNRISPEASVPVVEVCRRSYKPGGAANVAANVASLGGRVLLGGLIGNDHQATQLRTALEARGVNVEGVVVDDERPTTTKTRIVARNQQIVRIDSETRDPLHIELENVLLSWVETRIKEVDAYILSDYNKGLVSQRLAQQLIRLARQGNKPIIVDPKGSNYRKYRGATFVTPNLKEAEQALERKINNKNDVVTAGWQLLGLLKSRALLITRGAEGMSLFQKGSKVLHIPAVARDVFDVTGAGDTVVSLLALAMAAGYKLTEAVYLANQAAGMVVSKFGTATLTIDDLPFRNEGKITSPFATYQ